MKMRIDSGRPNDQISRRLPCAIVATGLLFAGCGGGADTTPTGSQTPSITIADASITEGDSGTATLSFPVSLSASSTSTVTVNYATADATATSPDDYATSNGLVTFAAGTTSQTITVTVNGDTDVEPDETMTVSLSGASNATIADGSATGTINNDDVAATLSIADASATEGDAGDVIMSFDVTLSAAASSVVSVDYATSDGTATSPTDYDAVSDTLTFAVGVTSQTVDVTVHGDTDPEANETLSVTLSGVSNATIADGSATGTINNDDVAPTLSIADASVTEGDAGDVIISFDVTLSAAASNVVSVDYATSDGTATSPTDYDAVSDTLTFAVGVTSQSVDVTVHGDTDSEANETLFVTLSSPANAAIADGSATGTIINDDAGSMSGLDSRPDNLTCVAPARPTQNASVSITEPFASLPNLNQPTKMILEPVPDPRWFVLLKPGQVVTFDPDNATSLDTFLDITPVRTDSEGGLLGMAFHPNYPATPEIFLSYTVDHTGPDMRSVISRFTLDSVSNPGGGTTEEIILVVDQDFDNHNGGDIGFGPDGYLYIGLGDGGSGGDPNNRAQDTTYLLGSMLRIDVTNPSTGTYDIPPGNPFATNAKCGPAGNADDCPEIYAWGLRNPWRWSFDPDTNELWAADVGQNAWEEINLIESGGNYGWRCREASNDFNTSGCNATYVDPVAEYSHSVGNSITGGFVYRGAAIPELAGRYVFADYGSGRFWALQPDGQGGFSNDELVDTSFGPTSFGVDENGELLFTDINSGRIRMLSPAGAPVPDTIPNLLSATGCTGSGDITQPYSGLVPYDLNAAFWSDGAVKDRFIGLPNGTTISRDGNGDWTFPNGTVIVKNFRLQGALVETRHLMRHPDGVWAGYTYEWNTQQTEATRVRGGKTVNVGGQDWIFPSQAQCMQCHTSIAGFSLGPETGQLNRDLTYPSTGRTANQLETLDQVMMFATPLPGPASGLEMIADPDDVTESLDDRARAYLHTNCAGCHRQGGPTPSSMDLRYTTSLSTTNACNVAPLLGNLGIVNALLIAPGDAGRSLVIERASRRDVHGMPPLGSNIVDATGITLLTNWVNSLGSCN